MSGIKLNNGDLSGKGISIVTEVTTTNREYDIESLEKIWWMWIGHFDLQTGTKSETVKLRNTTLEILQKIIDQNKITQ